MTRLGRPPRPFWDVVDKSGECWMWTGARNPEGYGLFVRTVQGHPRSFMAHRWAWIVTNGAIPVDRVIDHLCRNPSCVRPDHLEVVTQQENTHRGNGPGGQNARKTHCPRGHEFRQYANRRRCLACEREAYRVSVAEKRRRQGLA